MHALLTPSLWKWQGMSVGGVTILAMLGAPRLTRKCASPGGGVVRGLLAYFGLGLSTATCCASNRTHWSSVP